MSKAVVVLNLDYAPISVVSWKRALNLVLKGRAEIIESSDHVITNFEGTKSFVLPAVIKLVNFVKNVFKAKVSFTRKNTIIRDRHSCQYCGAKENLTVDHVIPSSKGGKSEWTNCVAACFRCNSLKGNKSLKDTGLKLKTNPKQPTLSEYIAAKIDVMKLNVNFY